MTSAPEQKAIAVIPARYASTRFPGKIIAPLCGKPLVLHAYERACQARHVSEALIATDDQHVVDALKPYDAPVVMTRNDHPSGTDRIAEVMGERTEPVVVNVQGDEPLIDPATIDIAIEALWNDPDAVMSTVCNPLSDPEHIANPNVVKTVWDKRGRALYFSRSPIPFIRDEADRAASHHCYWQHVGLYVYRRDFLMRYAQMEQTPLEQLEKLEQLRVLENGFSIAVAQTDYDCIGVDSPEDLERVRNILESNA